jgi:hypothetical protein
LVFMQTPRETMPETVLPQQQAAWDGARAFVRAAGSPHYEGFAARVLSRLGSELYGAFADSRLRLLTALVETGGDRHAAELEAGKWHVRLTELLRTRPELVGVIAELTAEGFEL